MAILVDAASRIMIQGMTGTNGAAFARRMVDFGTPLVAGVTPGKGGQTVAGIPVFDTVAGAVEETGASASLICVPPLAVREAFLEAALGGIRLVWVYTENVPVQDVAVLLAVAKQEGVRLLGPNSAGVVSPGRANLSDLNDAHMWPGPIGIVSKSGTLATEVLHLLGKHGLGQSSVVCLGGDPLIGTTYADVIRLFAADDETRAVVLIGEIGGRAELDALAAWTAGGSERKPLVAYIAGQAAPPGKRLGHAGAIVDEAGDSAAEKMRRFAAAGATVAPLLSAIPRCLHLALERTL